MEGGAPATPASEKSLATTQPATPNIPVSDKSIAVLPFENLSDEKSNSYFADGIQDEMKSSGVDVGAAENAPSEALPGGEEGEGGKTVVVKKSRAALPCSRCMLLDPLMPPNGT